MFVLKTTDGTHSIDTCRTPTCSRAKTNKSALCPSLQARTPSADSLDCLRPPDIPRRALLHAHRSSGRHFELKLTLLVDDVRVLPGVAVSKEGDLLGLETRLSECALDTRAVMKG